MTVRRLELTKFRLTGVKLGVKEGELKKMIDDFKLVEKFNQSGRGKKILKAQRRSELTDFDRFKVMILKRRLAKVSRT